MRKSHLKCSLFYKTSTQKIALLSVSHFHMAQCCSVNLNKRLFKFTNAAAFLPCMVGTPLYTKSSCFVLLACIFFSTPLVILPKCPNTRSINIDAKIIIITEQPLASYHGIGPCTNHIEYFYTCETRNFLLCSAFLNNQTWTISWYVSVDLVQSSYVKGSLDWSIYSALLLKLQLIPF